MTGVQKASTPSCPTRVVNEMPFSNGEHGKLFGADAPFLPSERRKGEEKGIEGLVFALRVENRWLRGPLSTLWGKGARKTRARPSLRCPDREHALYMGYSK